MDVNVGFKGMRDYAWGELESMLDTILERRVQRPSATVLATYGSVRRYINIAFDHILAQHWKTDYPWGRYMTGYRDPLKSFINHGHFGNNIENLKTFIAHAMLRVMEE